MVNSYKMATVEISSARDSLFCVGEIVSAHAGALTARLPQGAVGDLCWVVGRDGRQRRGQIIAFHDSLFSVSTFEDPDGICPGAEVRTRGSQVCVPVGPELIGRVINPLGEPLDEPRAQGLGTRRRAVLHRPPPACTRPLISEPLGSGVRAIDAFCTLGYGQRMGIFAGAGVGKSTLLGLIARAADVDVIVVALVGERSREVQEFIEDTLGPEGLARSILVVATSDDSALMRQTAPYTATAIAEHLRDSGKRVLLIVDSLTRMARAVRETSLAAGELPIRHGYTNSVYTQLPKLLERAGTSPHGSITALYTVLTNQDDDIDPLADEIKSLLDGHIVLRKEIAMAGVYPAIDITASISRLFNRLHSAEYRATAQTAVRATSRYFKEREIVLLGGSPDAELKRILDHHHRLLGLVRQGLHERSTLAQALEQVRGVVELL
jgi:FliI/YscN family ATPase